MTSPAGEKMSSKRGAFCSDECRNNPNGCSYCGRTGPQVGSRILGTVRTLSGKVLPAYQECVSLNNAKQRQEWATRHADGRVIHSATTLRSFQPGEII